MKTTILKYFTFIVILIGLSVNSFSQNTTFGEEEEPVDYFLGYRIISTYSSPVQFALIYAPNDIVEEISIISMTTFLAYATGTTKCDANPKKENMFQKYNIENQGIVGDLWKLRYKNYPFKTTTGLSDFGWSTNDSVPTMPSEEQFLILNNFGISKISDFCYGDNAFNLLKSMETNTWVEAYKAAF